MAHFTVKMCSRYLTLRERERIYGKKSLDRVKIPANFWISRSTKAANMVDFPYPTFVKTNYDYKLQNH